MASNTKDSNLFGEDSDDSSDDDSATPAKQDDAAAPAADDNGGEKAANDKDSDDSDEDVKEKEPAAPATANKNSALFGDEDSSSEDEGEFKGDDDGIVGKAGGNAKAPVVGRSMNEKLGLESDSDDDHKPTKPKEEAPRKYVPPRKMELLDLPGTNNNKNANNKKNKNNEIIHHITKLPNLVGIQPKPYNANTHDMEKEEEEYKGSVHNMIRWRYKTDSKGEYVRDESGNPIKESNARFVKWSDGSYTLHVGREVLEVDNLDSSVPKDSADETRAGFADINGYLYVSQKAKIRPPSQKEIDGPIAEGESDDEEGDDDAAPAKPAGTVLECIGQIASRLALRPSSLSSDAHRNLKLAVQKRNVKRARIAEIVTEFDPELQKQARIKGKDDLAKSRARSAGGRRSGGGGGGYRRKTGMNERYLEEEDDYDGVNLSRLKRRTMRRDEYSEEDDEIMDYGEDSEEEEEDEWDKKKKRKRGAAASARAAKKAVESEEEEDESGEDGEVVFGDDDDEEDDNVNLAKKHNRGGGTKKTVFGDDDDD